MKETTLGAGQDFRSSVPFHYNLTFIFFLRTAEDPEHKSTSRFITTILVHFTGLLIIYVKFMLRFW